MIRSMTGFGEASEQVDGVNYAVELRSLNNRYFKAAIRLPDEIAGLEAELETQLRHRLNRGSITLTVRLRASDAAATHKVNEVALLAYLDHLETIKSKLGKNHGGGGDGGGGGVNIDLTALLAMPGVLQPQGQDLMLRARPAVTKLVEQACAKLEAMRASEGQFITQDLGVQRRFILDRLEIIRKRAPQVIEEYHTRLRTRIDELLARAEFKLDERDLIREIAIFAERSDISEEITRLGGHLEQYEQIMQAKANESAGRTLDFLAQELLREANTIASKSNDATISRAIVEVKGAIDRIKEQVQNVE
ncbi:MAG: YicC family protein [Planctomycetota bacterium]|nr:YicC family protein [Planctomycetota bacterium]